MTNNCDCANENVQINTGSVGNVTIHLQIPNFADYEFIPKITMNNSLVSISWGESVLFNDLILGSTYKIKAETVTKGNYVYIPVISSELVEAQKESPIVDIYYIEQPRDSKIEFTAEYDCMCVNDDCKNMYINIRNTGDIPIVNWKLTFDMQEFSEVLSVWDYEFVQINEQVVIDPGNQKIMPNDEMQIMLKIKTNEEVTQFFNFHINSVPEVIKTSSVVIYVFDPIYNRNLFVPCISVGVDSKEILWGTAEIYDGIEIGKTVKISGEVIEIDNIRYVPIMDTNNFVMEDNNPVKVNVRYMPIEISNDLQYDIDLDISNYPGGFTCNVQINNLTNNDINGWVLDFEFLNDQMITDGWSSTIEQNGKNVRVNPASWNTIIRGNQSVAFGFSATSSSSINYPLDFVLNGATPVPRYTTIKLKLDNPTFDRNEYTPRVLLDGKNTDLEWGMTKEIRVLAQSIHKLDAQGEIGDMNAYLSNYRNEDLYVNVGESLEVNIFYYKVFNNPSIFSGYFASWADPYTEVATETQLATLAPYVAYVPIAFGKPFMDYTGSENDKENYREVTGLEFSYNYKVFMDSINILKERNPYVKILLSLGGENYNNWEDLNPQAIALFIKDFNLDGVDIDYEQDIGGANCRAGSDGLVRCLTDQKIIRVITSLRQVLPREDGYIITFSAWSVGAYGEGMFKDAPPANLTTTGVMLTPLREAGVDMDFMNLMAYNAIVTGQPPYVPEQAGEAYKFYFPTGKVGIGAHVPPDAQGNDYWNLDNVIKAARFSKANNIGGMMLWYLQRKSEVPGSSNTQIAEAIRENLGYPPYPGPLYINAE